MNRPLDSLIFIIRDQKMILDADLADLYGVPTKRLENFNRFSPRHPDF
jgi:hypothetical protein